MALPPFEADTPDVLTRHLLVLPADAGVDEVETLAQSRFTRAVWEVEPSGVVPRPATGGRTPRLAATPPGVLRLSRVSTLVGPYLLDRALTTSLGLPTSAGQAYVLHAPVERGAPPWPGGGDRDGLARAFPDGLPVRDEERVVKWLVDTARRLGGAVRVAPTAGGTSTLLIPDPAAAVDLTVWSDIWLEPEAALAVMRRALPRAQLNLPTMEWSGPPVGTGTRPVRGAEDMDPEDRARLHEAADQHDMAVLADPPPMEGYGAVADLQLDGMIALEVAGETELPVVMKNVPWAAEGAVAYRVLWEPADLHELESERPDLTHRVARGRAAPLVVAVTRAVHKAVGGEITDMMGFVVDPADL